MMESSIRCCIACGCGSSRRVAAWNGYRIVRCGGCGLVFVDPRPPADRLPELYREYHSRFGVGESDWERLMRDVFLEAAELLEPMRWGPGPHRLLDVGCGYGTFVSRMRDRGWDAVGLDPSPATVSAASAKGIPVRLSTLEGIQAEDGRYRAVTMFYVLEHLFDPIAALRKVFSLLEPGGALLLRVPDTTPVVRILSPFGWGASLYDPPFHLYDFPPAVLEGMLIDVGFVRPRTFPGRNTVPVRIGARLATSFFGAVARVLFKGSGGWLLLPGVSKTTLARKPS